MAKKDIPDAKGGPGKRRRYSVASEQEAIRQEHKQVIEAYIESLREFAKSILRKIN
jgi:hypothetical protein